MKTLLARSTNHSHPTGQTKMTISAIRTITATECRATCLDPLGQVGTSAITRPTISKRGKAVAVVTPAEQHVFDAL